MRALVLAALCLFAAQPLVAQSFSCRIGTRAACLEFGDTVCSARGMCVDNDSACFNRYQCDSQGFTCRSNVVDCLDEYDDLVRRHNALVAEAEVILQRHNTLVDDYNRQLEDLNRQLIENRELISAQDDARSCINRASTLEAARACLSRLR